MLKKMHELWNYWLYEEKTSSKTIIWFKLLSSLPYPEPDDDVKKSNTNPKKPKHFFIGGYCISFWFICPHEKTKSNRTDTSSEQSVWSSVAVAGQSSLTPLSRLCHEWLCFSAYFLLNAVLQFLMCLNFSYK